MASIAVQKLSEAASNSIAPPAAKVLTPTIIRLPYRGAKVPAAKELTFRTTHATVIKVPICVYDKPKLVCIDGNVKLWVYCVKLDARLTKTAISKITAEY
jgi:hypothetical protein